MSNVKDEFHRLRVTVEPVTLDEFVICLPPSKSIMSTIMLLFRLEPVNDLNKSILSLVSFLTALSLSTSVLFGIKVAGLVHFILVFSTTVASLYTLTLLFVSIALTMSSKPFQYLKINRTHVSVTNFIFIVSKFELAEILSWEGEKGGFVVTTRDGNVNYIRSINDGKITSEVESILQGLWRTDSPEHNPDYELLIQSIHSAKISTQSNPPM